MPVASRQMGSSKSHHWDDAQRNHCTLPAPQQHAGSSLSKSLRKMAPSLTPKISNGTLFLLSQSPEICEPKRSSVPLGRTNNILHTRCIHCVTCICSCILSSSWPSTISNYWILSINPSCPSLPSPHALPKHCPPPTSTASQLMDG
jgi:hypothetical protein